MIDLERELDAKQALKLEIRHLTGNLQVVKHMGADDGDEEVLEKFVAIQRELEEKEEELQDLEALSQALIVKERNSNDELQEARKELINVSTQHYHISHSIPQKVTNELLQVLFYTLHAYFCQLLNNARKTPSRY